MRWTRRTAPTRHLKASGGEANRPVLLVTNQLLMDERAKTR